MANTYTLISSNTVGVAGTSAVTFSSIPSTYTDLLVVASARGLQVGVNSTYDLRFNGTTVGWVASKRLYGSGAAAASDTTTPPYLNAVGSTATASVFSNDQIYIPNYTSSNYKSVSIDCVTENNAATAYAAIEAGLWQDTSVISSVTLTGVTSNFVQYSTFYLYGIKNS